MLWSLQPHRSAAEGCFGRRRGIAPAIVDVHRLPARHSPPLAILNVVNLGATLTGAARTRRPSKPGPIGSWEELALRQLRLLRMIELLTQGYSYRGIRSRHGH